MIYPILGIRRIEQSPHKQEGAHSSFQEIEMKEGYGKSISQQREAQKRKLLMGLSQQRKIGADAARQTARDQMASGIGDMVGGITSAATGMPMG